MSIRRSQTWEQPDHVWEGLEGHAGDNDPVDVVDVSATPVGCGAIIEFKPITALAMIDEGEVDWKVSWDGDGAGWDAVGWDWLKWDEMRWDGTGRERWHGAR